MMTGITRTAVALERNQFPKLQLSRQCCAFSCSTQMKLLSNFKPKQGELCTHSDDNVHIIRPRDVPLSLDGFLDGRGHVTDIPLSLVS